MSGIASLGVIVRAGLIDDRASRMGGGIDGASLISMR